MEIVTLLTVPNLAVALFFVGLYGAMTQRNIIKTIIAVSIMDIAAITLFMTANYQPGARPPLSGVPVEQMADPIPQALMITAIVIGVSIIAMCLAVYLRVAYRYGTGDWKILIRRLEK